VVVGRGARVVEVEGGIDVDEDASSEVDIVSGAPVVDVTRPVGVAGRRAFNAVAPVGTAARTTMAKPAMPAPPWRNCSSSASPQSATRHPPGRIGGPSEPTEKFTNGEGMARFQPRSSMEDGWDTAP